MESSSDRSWVYCVSQACFIWRAISLVFLLLGNFPDTERPPGLGVVFYRPVLGRSCFWRSVTGVAELRGAA